jgi:DNA-binding transcriptional MerR regulator
MTTKSTTAFRTISEVSEELEVPQHVLRFWETRFPQVRPMKRAGGRRYYRPEDVELLRRIRDMLYRQGLTIRGVQQVLKAERRPGRAGAAEEPAAVPAGDPMLRELYALRDELVALRRLLSRQG